MSGLASFSKDCHETWLSLTTLRFLSDNKDFVSALVTTETNPPDDHNSSSRAPKLGGGGVPSFPIYRALTLQICQRAGKKKSVTSLEKVGLT